ncbi:MAG TPA: dihydrofolate reductase family protein [Roseiflexaceae bacterium]|nr:dihydrofolate reductase family protein [Roseiflexaceae bacterium]
MQPHGPGSTFTLLFDDEAHLPTVLPEPFRQIYQGDWHPLTVADRPYTFVNFVTARDGRVSFAEPGHAGGGDISGFSAPDRWVMALLRAGADAILMGEGTLHSEPDHLWTSAFIFPDDAAAFAELRSYLGHRPQPLHVFLSLEGRLDPAAAVFAQPDIQVVIATTEAGRREAEARLRGCAARIDVLALGETGADLHQLTQILYRQYGIRSLLCEGGPRVYGAMLHAGLIDEEFVTLSPLIIGEHPGKPRPSLVEGAGFAPGQAPRSTLISLRRVQDHLFLRSRWSYHHR